MLATVVLLLLGVSMASAYDRCRRQVRLPQPSTCGPDRTMFNEGICLCCYKDTKDIPTIGIGFNLQRGDAARVLSRYGLRLEDVLQDCQARTTRYCLTEQQAKDIFNTVSYPEVAPCVENYAPGLPPQKKAAVMDVAFAGCGTLNKFKKMQAALKRRDWTAAGAELKDSAWCRQVGPNRCNSDYNCIVGA